MASSIKELTDNLRHALERTALEYERAAALYRRTQAALPEQPMNAPLSEAVTLLAAHGFIVMHKDRVDRAIGVVRAACDDEHENHDEAERLDILLAYMKAQRNFAS